ncbi:MAG: GAF domain-containing protein [Candidatus Marinimicrobia bacterium]|nr:GAF domain-containing protein [Candidatus Neomarinimicrobiota bacterium]
MNTSKNSIYNTLLQDMTTVIGPVGKYQPNLIGKMAISSAMIMKYLPELVFTGYYLLENDLLHIGPYQGTIIACTPIVVGKGVCGACAFSGKPIIVKDVQNYPNYIACDQETQSEIVLPVIEYEKLIAILDIDGRNVNQFDETDVHYLSAILKMLF